MQHEDRVNFNVRSRSIMSAALSQWDLMGECKIFDDLSLTFILREGLASFDVLFAGREFDCKIFREIKNWRRRCKQKKASVKPQEKKKEEPDLKIKLTKIASPLKRYSSPNTSLANVGKRIHQEAAKRVSFRTYCLKHEIKFYPSYRWELPRLKQQRVVAERAPSCSLILGSDVSLLLRSLRLSHLEEQFNAVIKSLNIWHKSNVLGTPAHIIQARLANLAAFGSDPPPACIFGLIAFAPWSALIPTTLEIEIKRDQERIDKGADSLCLEKTSPHGHADSRDQAKHGAKRSSRVLDTIRGNSINNGAKRRCLSLLHSHPEVPTDPLCPIAIRSWHVPVDDVHSTSENLSVKPFFTCAISTLRVNDDVEHVDLTATFVPWLENDLTSQDCTNSEVLAQTQSGLERSTSSLRNEWAQLCTPLLHASHEPDSLTSCFSFPSSCALSDFATAISSDSIPPPVSCFPHSIDSKHTTTLLSLAPLFPVDGIDMAATELFSGLTLVESPDSSGNCLRSSFDIWGMSLSTFSPSISRWLLEMFPAMDSGTVASKS